MRILHVSSVHRPFDARIFRKEASTLAAHGYDVTLAITTDRSFTRDGIAFIPLGKRKPAILHRALRALRASLEMLRRPSDIVHIHDPELLPAAVPALLAGRRLVYDAHEFYSERIRQVPWIPTSLRAILSIAYDAFERILLPNFAGIVVVTERMALNYRRFKPADRIALVRNFPEIPPADIERARRSDPPIAGPYVIHTGGASPHRLFHVIVEAAELLRKRGIDAPIVNLGDIGVDGYGSEAAALLDRARAADVRNLGIVPYDELLRWLAHARAGYLALSDLDNYHEALPTKLFEYFAFALPTVATPARTSAAIIARTNSGIVVPYDDASAHADALQQILTDDAVHQRLSSGALAAAPAYTFDCEYAALDRLYRNIAG